jgi:soluble lytic murein transglycosylase-like protein
MHELNLAPTISNAMLENHLPPQFLYLALHESDFNTKAIGPETRFGIAKGIWQFIPSTAMRYGLRTGPLVELPRHDPRDERFDTQLATEAAARYLRDLYSKEAQASGLLVIASYNWGPTNIRKRIRNLPENPRERNFWQLLKQHNIPKETHDYVFYIVSAIVIGENPSLFGFDFENPLESLESGRVET